MIGVASLLCAVPGAGAATRASTSASATGGTSMSSSSTRALRYRSRGRDVAAAQRKLRSLGYPVRVSGYYSAQMRAVVRRFERYHHLRVDGWLSQYDLAVLDQAVANHSAGTRSYTRGRQQPFPATATRAGLNADGTATPPTDAPIEIQEMIDAGNQIASKPYKYGGGHGHWQDTGYDCSGSVSYALHGAGLLKQALTSGGFESWGSPGPGKWVTILANGGHVFMYVAGLRFDTSGASEAGTRWQVAHRPQSGYVVRHPTGL
jgi:peptidoglycan hydrolase-like protein with peptidoglycan-binding domain